MTREKISDDEIEKGFQQILAFQKAHPKLKAALALWMADGAMLEVTDPAAAAICAREAPTLRG